MLSMGLTGRMVTDWLGATNLKKYGVRFTKQVWPGDTLTAKGEVTDVHEEGGKQIVTVRLVTVNQNGESVVEGEAVAALGLRAGDAVVLQNSNRLMLRLTPCDIVARIAPLSYMASAEFEVEMAQGLAAAGSPVAALDPRVEPRVYANDGFVLNLWSYYEPVMPLEVAAPEYAKALERLHEGMRQLDIAAPHFMDRVAEAERLVGSRELTPALADQDRELLGRTLQRLGRTIDERGTVQQLLHGEPHAGNLLMTKDGPLFIDLETCCRGPVEFDVAHAPEAVSRHYPGADPDLVRDCRVLILAMVASWRWDRDDEFPDGLRMGHELLGQLREELGLSG
jgi:hypothetical protein